MNLASEAAWDIVTELGMSARLCISGFFLAQLLNGFLSGRRTAVLIGSVYSGLLLFLYWIPAELDGMHVYPLVMAAATLLACHLSPPTQRSFVIFLCVTFYALREIAVTVAGSIYGRLYDATVLAPEAASRPFYQYGMFIVCTAVYALLMALLLFLAVHAIRRAYPAGRTRLTWREFWLLTLPSIAASIASDVLRELRYPLASTDEYATAALQASVVLAILFASILGTILLFAQINREQHNRRQQEALAVQLSDMKQYVGDLEALYTRLRGFRHDLANHLETLSGLEAAGDWQAAAAYAESSRERIAEILPRIQSGNPVTDVILSSLQLQAEQQGIHFTSSFRFPSGAIDPFDLGIILHNAGTNALEGAESAEDPFAEVRSWRHRQAFITEITNGCRPSFTASSAAGGLETSKEDHRNHGFGLANIQAVAARYGGRCELEAHDGICVLTVMLMLPPG